jgi:quinohemoprotein ethanol dehydrogenase
VEFQQSVNGGVLATAGGLVFQGDGLGFLSGYDADSGERLWQRNLYSPMMAPPISYAIDGTQYLAILTGGVGAPGTDAEKLGSTGRVVVMKLNGTTALPALIERDLTIPEQPPLTASAEDLARGQALYQETCVSCHGPRRRGGLPDLRLMSEESHQAFLAIVLGGTKKDNGMASFADLLTADDAERIHRFIISQAVKDRQAQQNQPQVD